MIKGKIKICVNGYYYLINFVDRIGDVEKRQIKVCI